MIRGVRRPSRPRPGRGEGRGSVAKSRRGTVEEEGTIWGRRATCVFQLRKESWGLKRCRGQGSYAPSTTRSVEND